MSSNLIVLKDFSFQWFVGGSFHFYSVSPVQVRQREWKLAVFLLLYILCALAEFFLSLYLLVICVVNYWSVLTSVICSLSCNNIYGRRFIPFGLRLGPEITITFFSYSH